MSSPTGTHRHAAIETSLGKDVLLLRSFSGREELGRLFDYHLVLIDPKKDVDPDDLIGTNATIRLQLEKGGTRFFNGYIASLSFLGYETGAGIYHAHFVPWLWLLSRTSDCRIFQEKTVKQILEELFKDHGFTDFEFKLSGSYKPKIFCTQYNETALNFVSRLMEHEGIYYYWRHENGKHTMVIVDAMSHHQDCPSTSASIEWRPKTGVMDTGYLYDLRLQKTVSPGAYASSDYNFKKPKQDLRSKKSQEKKHAAKKFELFEYPGVFRENGDGDNITKVRLEESQAQHEVIEATVTARCIASGYKFALKKAPRKDQDRKYLVVSTSISISLDSYASGGGSGDKFDCSISAIPDSTTFRPARISPKPRVQGPQTAMVVGPKGEEIFCDEFGRVKLHFYYDRRSKADEKSSKWVRVSQPSAGAGYGMVSLPRVGQEVIVEYLHGDPDQPIVTGRVYNGDNKLAYGLPANKTRTSLKSSSYPGGGGFNEMRFEDKKGQEQIFMHGQKDMDTKIGKERRTSIGTNQHSTVGTDSMASVGRDSHANVGRNRTENIGVDFSLTVGANQLEKIGADHHLSIGANQKVTVGASSQYEAGMEIYQKAGMKIVIEAGMAICLKAGSSFITLDPSGVTIQGPLIRINSGGAPIPGSPIPEKKPASPKKPTAASSAGGGAPEKAKGMGHGKNPQNWKNQRVEDYAHVHGSAFYSKPRKSKS